MLRYSQLRYTHSYTQQTLVTTRHGFTTGFEPALDFLALVTAKEQVNAHAGGGPCC